MEFKYSVVSWRRDIYGMKRWVREEAERAELKKEIGIELLEEMEQVAIKTTMTTTPFRKDSTAVYEVVCYPGNMQEKKEWETEGYKFPKREKQKNVFFPREVRGL